MKTSLLFIMLVGVGGIFLICCGLIVVRGLSDDAKPSDVIVVLGNAVLPGGAPSPRLQSRLDESLALYKNHVAPLIFVSGGVGKEGYKEGDVMRDYLLAHGVPSVVIIVDNDGVDTWATAKNTKALLDMRGLHSAVVVSNYYHVARTRFAFQKVGIINVTSAHARFVEPRDLYSIPREVAAFGEYILK